MEAWRRVGLVASGMAAIGALAVPGMGDPTKPGTDESRPTQFDPGVSVTLNAIYLSERVSVFGDTVAGRAAIESGAMELSRGDASISALWFSPAGNVGTDQARAVELARTEATAATAELLFVETVPAVGERAPRVGMPIAEALLIASSEQRTGWGPAGGSGRGSGSVAGAAALELAGDVGGVAAGSGGSVDAQLELIEAALASGRLVQLIGGRVVDMGAVERGVPMPTARAMVPRLADVAAGSVVPGPVGPVPPWSWGRDGLPTFGLERARGEGRAGVRPVAGGRSGWAGPILAYLPGGASGVRSRVVASSQ